MSMIPRRTLASILAATLLVQGCAVTQPSTQLQSGDRSQIKTIAMAVVTEPAEYPVSQPSGAVAGAAGVFLGVIGAVVVAAVEGSIHMAAAKRNTAAMMAAFGDKPPRLGQVVQSELYRELKARGYTMVLVPQEIKIPGGGQPMSCPDLGGGADALLVVEIGGGFFDTDPVTPMLQMKTRLASADCSRTIYESAKAWHRQNLPGYETIPIPDEAKIPDRTELFKRPDHAKGVLEQGARTLVSRVAADL